MSRKRRIEYRAVSDLRPYPKNVRIHPARQINLLVKSIRKFKMTTALVIDEGNVILAGLPGSSKGRISGSSGNRASWPFGCREARLCACR